MKRFIILLTSFFSLMIVIFIINLESALETTVHYFLKSRNLENFSFNIRKIGINKVVIEDIKWNQYCLSIDKIHYSYSLLGLIQKRYGSLLIENMHSCYQHQAPAVNTSSQSIIQPPPLLLPKLYPIFHKLNFDKIEINQLFNTAKINAMEIKTCSTIIYSSENNSKKLLIDTLLEQKQLQIKIKAQGDFSQNEEKFHIFDLTFPLPNGKSLHVKNIDFYNSSDPSIQSVYKIDHLDFDHFSFEHIKMNCISDNLSDSIKGELKITGIQNKKLGIKNINLGSFYHFNREKLSIDLNLTTSYSPLQLKIKGDYFLNSSRGDFSIKMPKTMIKDKDVIKQIYSKIPEDIKSLNLHYYADGHLVVDNKIIKPKISLNLTNASFAYKDHSLSNLSGTFKLTSIVPLKIFADIHIPSIEKPIPITKLACSITLNNMLIMINFLRFEMWDGLVHTPGAIYNRAQKSFTPTSIKFENISLNRIFNFLNKPNLKGDGIVAGELPLTFNGIIPLVNNGHIYSKAKGNLQLKLDQGAKQTVVRNQHVNILTDFLENLDYEKISLDFSTNEKLDLRSQLRILGNNPGLQDKYQRRPLEFKMTLNFNIVKMLKSQGASLELPEKIEKIILQHGK